MARAHRVTHLDQIPSPTQPEPGDFQWKPVRRHFGVRSFGINAMVAEGAGDWVVEDHDEMGGNAAQHEEIYFVARGHARFQVGEEEIDAPAGTFVYVPDPEGRRSARAVEPGTAVLAVGGKPSEAFRVSRWEQKYFDEPSAPA